MLCKLLLSDEDRYRRLVGKLYYLIVTWPDIFFAVSLVSQYIWHFLKVLIRIQYLYYHLHYIYLLFPLVWCFFYKSTCSLNLLSDILSWLLRFSELQMEKAIGGGYEHANLYYLHDSPIPNTSRLSIIGELEETCTKLKSFIFLRMWIE